MRGAHLALAVNNPETTLLTATVKFLPIQATQRLHRLSAIWVTAHAPPEWRRARTSTMPNFSASPKPGAAISPFD
jgi:hypothetical protein